MADWLYFDYFRGLAAVSALILVFVLFWFLTRWERSFPLKAALAILAVIFSVFLSHIVYLFRLGLLVDWSLWLCGCGYDPLVLWILFSTFSAFLFLLFDGVITAFASVCLSLTLLFVPVGVSPLLPLAVLVFSFAGRWFGLLLAGLNFWALYWVFSVKIESEGWLYAVALLPLLTLFFGGWLGESVK